MMTPHSVRTGAAAVALLAALALAGCTSNDKGSASTSATPETTTTATTPVETTGAATTPSGAGVDPAAAQRLRSAADATVNGRTQDQAVYTAMVMDAASGQYGTCSVVATTTDETGATTSAEVTSSVAQDLSNSATMCDTSSLTMHVILIGTDGYVEKPVGSGTYQQVTIAPEVLTEITETSNARLIDAASALIDDADSVTQADANTVVLSYDSVASLIKAATTLGLDTASYASATAGTMTYTYHIDPSTGLIDGAQEDIAVQVSGGGVQTSTIVGFTYSLASPIAAPSSVEPGDGTTITSLSDLTTLAVGS